MESLSRPFHSRKLSNPTTTTFSPKKPHDGVFSGHRHTYAGASPIDVQDYREIFGSSPAVSSIPVLDLSTLREPSDALNLNLKYRSSRPEPDYSKIFRCFPDDDVAVSCEKSFARDKPRSPSSKTSSSPDSDNFSHQSSDVLNRFNMSYNKISQKSKDGLDGTKHVTQFHAVPGFTRFIDEEAVPPLMEAKKHESFKSFDNLSSVSSPTTVTNRKDYPKRSTANNSSGTFSPVYVDVNSAASTSAAALKQAIEKAQESIRIAKESVGRKKKGLRSFSSKSMKDVTANEEHKYKDDVRQVFQRATQDVGSRSRKYFMDSEKLFGVKKVLDEINGKISESNNLTVPQKVEEDEMKVPKESNQNEKQEETCDYNLQESKENCYNRLEESEVILQDEDNFCDQEVDENLSFDKKKSDEIDSEDDIHVASNIEMDNNVETIQETITVFAEIGTEENDFQSESELEEEEEKEKEKEEEEEEEEISEIESTNEIQNEEERIDEVAGEENKERVDEVAAREREREKDRLAVDRAIREARERARERAERAAVEKATEEIRQRMRTDASEKAAKASAQSKLRAERAAVERATSEARQRALEKAMTKKPLYDSRKAKLEKDNKIMERAAKALAEKEKRDLLAQKEQAERNRLAENLDADIKKWSSGKEGNLRALLSTLQYILGVESGWQPVTLTEIVATSAVKKAYRKATLCVHPDKLQQRGASIQQKYICEKVFDLLKAAWSKFNSEER